MPAPTQASLNLPVLDLPGWLQRLERLHPREIELGLKRVSRVWSRMRPDGLAGCRIITIAGTNGKGSCAALLEAILSAGGYRTGCYTSPHLLRYNERIRIDGQEASDQVICDAFQRIDACRGDISLTYFEFGTLAALDIFAGHSLDVLILEVGLGGRLDAVNIVDPDLALITGVDLDHMDWLGSDRDSIALEKAGILRPERPAVYGDLRAPESLLRRAAELAAPLYRLARDYRYAEHAGGWQWEGLGHTRFALPMPGLRGDCQLRNAAAVLMVLELLSSALPVDQAAVRRGLLSSTLPGRFQVLPGDVSLVLDVAHNPQAAGVLAHNLAELAPRGRVHAVFAMLKDKDLEGVLAAIAGRIDTWHLAQLPGSRALALDRLVARVGRAVPGVPLAGYDSVPLALEGARRVAAPGDVVLVFGSFLTVARVLERL
jgi:dihydrofolate synthase/folylpolyglutamate synthase